jgi:hypothetical protein
MAYKISRGSWGDFQDVWTRTDTGGEAVLMKDIHERNRTDARGNEALQLRRGRIGTDEATPKEQNVAVKIIIE